MHRESGTSTIELDFSLIQAIFAHTSTITGMITPAHHLMTQPIPASRHLPPLTRQHAL